MRRIARVLLVAASAAPCIRVSAQAAPAANLSMTDAQVAIVVQRLAEGAKLS